MATLAMGNAAARIIAIVTIPILTRIYSPQDYGTLAVFTAFLILSAPLLTFCYTLAVPLPRHDGTAMNLMALSSGLLAVSTLAIGLLLWAFGPLLLGFMSMEALAPWWWLIALGLLGTGGYEIMSAWATRRRAYRPLARTQVLQSVTGASVKIGLGLLSLRPEGLLIGQVFTQSGGIASLGRRFLPELHANIRHVTLRRLKLVAGRYRSFPVYRLPSQMLLAVSRQAPLIFTAILYGAETTGQLGMALMALSLPVNLLSNSMGKAYYAEAARIGGKDPAALYALTRAVLARMAVIGIFPTLILMIFGRELFSIVFGAQWDMAGVFCSVLAITLFTQFISMPISQALSVIERNRTYLLYHATRAVLTIAIFTTAFIVELSAYEVIMIYSVGLSLQRLFQTCVILRTIRSLSLLSMKPKT